jgi:outer membrane protein TolC
VAVGAKFDFTPAAWKARLRSKQADVDKLREKESFARKGITLQVKNAWHTAKEAEANIESARKGLDAAQRWVMAAGLVYGIGTGEARDALEGVAARAKAEKDYYQAIYDYNQSLRDRHRERGLIWPVWLKKVSASSAGISRGLLFSMPR